MQKDRLPSSFAAAVIGGGKGTRLAAHLGGASKWLLRVHGRTIRDRQLELLYSLTGELLFAGGDCARTADIPPQVRCVPDMLPVGGPLAGLHSALFHAAADTVLVLPCDAPHPVQALLRHLLCLAAQWPDAPAVVPRQADGFWMPLVAVYRRSCVPFMETLAQQGIPHVFRLFELLEKNGTPAVAPPMESLRRYDAGLNTFVNINTPDDLQALQHGNPRPVPSLAARPQRWQRS